MRGRLTRLLRRHGWSLLAILAILCVGLVACGLVRVNTELGVGLRGDSFSYVSGARSLAAGLGYSRVSGGGEVKPITHFPPLFSMLLAGLQVAGWDAVPAARCVVIVLFGVNTILVGALGWRASGRPWVGVAAAAAFGFNPLFVDVHSWAMSEPLFITLTLLTIHSLPDATAIGRARSAVLPGLLAGLSFLTRYVGVACILAGAGALALTGPRNRRLRQAAVLVGISLLPAAAWIARNVWVSGTTANRVLLWHPVEWDRLLQAGNTLLAWQLPDGLLAPRPWFSTLGILLWLGALAFALRTFLHPVVEGDARAAADVLLRAQGLFILAYVGVVAANLVFLDASTPLDARILSPALAVLTPLAVGAAVRCIWRGPVLAKAAGAAVALALLAGYMTEGRALLHDGRYIGWGFSHRAWQTSPLMSAVRDLPPMILYTNEPEVLYFHADRPSYIVFGPVNPTTREPREGYAEWLSEARRTLAGGEAALVFVHYQALLADPGDRAMVETLSEGLVMVGEYRDGAIFMAGGSP